MTVTRTGSYPLPRLSCASLTATVVLVLAAELIALRTRERRLSRTSDSRLWVGDPRG